MVEGCRDEKAKWETTAAAGREYYAPGSTIFLPIACHVIHDLLFI